MFVLLVFLSFAAFAQTTTLTAPWLLVYDPEGRPRWEIRMENLIRTKDGWEGEGVNITLFF
jgi:lipopolysaccharide export system protein LptC